VDVAAVQGAAGGQAVARALVAVVHQLASESIADLGTRPKNRVGVRIQDWAGQQKSLADDLPKVSNVHEPTISVAQMTS
jgi:hypothetical protein